MTNKMSYDEIAAKKPICAKEDLALALNQINDYAREHSLTGQNLRDYFNEGIAAVYRNAARKQHNDQAHPPPEAGARNERRL